jgi:hypothetical protein
MAGRELFFRCGGKRQVHCMPQPASRTDPLMRSATSMNGFCGLPMSCGSPGGEEKRVETVLSRDGEGAAMGLFQKRAARNDDQRASAP